AAAEHRQHARAQADLRRHPQSLATLAHRCGEGGAQGAGDEEQGVAELVDALERASPAHGAVPRHARLARAAGGHRPPTWMPIAVRTRLARNRATKENTTVSLTASPTLFGPPVTANPR